MPAGSRVGDLVVHAASPRRRGGRLAQPSQPRDEPVLTAVQVHLHVPHETRTVQSNPGKYMGWRSVDGRQAGAMASSCGVANEGSPSRDRGSVMPADLGWPWCLFQLTAWFAIRSTGAVRKRWTHYASAIRRFCRWRTLPCCGAETGGLDGGGDARGRPGRQYGVKLVRGPFVQLAPHPEACDDEDEFLAYAARLRAEGARLAADLFSGAGGLSLGLEAAGYRVVLAADTRSRKRSRRTGIISAAWRWTGTLATPDHVDEDRRARVGCGRGAAGRRASLPAVLQGWPEQDPASCPERPARSPR